MKAIGRTKLAKCPAGKPKQFFISYCKFVLRKREMAIKVQKSLHLSFVRMEIIQYVDSKSLSKTVQCNQNFSKVLRRKDISVILCNQVMFFPCVSASCEKNIVFWVINLTFSEIGTDSLDCFYGVYEVQCFRSEFASLDSYVSFRVLSLNFSSVRKWPCTIDFLRDPRTKKLVLNCVFCHTKSKCSHKKNNHWQKHAILSHFPDIIDRVQVGQRSHTHIQL